MSGEAAPGAPEPTGPPARDVGIGLIVGYKAAKAGLELALLAALALHARPGAHDAWRALGTWARHHLASHWSAVASHAVDAVTSGRGLHLVEAGLALDALLTALEGWSLWRSHWWGAWLVVCATAIPLPWELWAFARHPSPARLAVGAANLAVAGYLAWRLGQARRREAEGADAGAP